MKYENYLLPCKTFGPGELQSAEDAQHLFDMLTFLYKCLDNYFLKSASNQLNHI